MDFYKDGKFVRSYSGRKITLPGNLVIMGVDPKVGSPEHGLYPRVNTPKPDHDPETQRILTTYSLVKGESVQAHEVVDLPQDVLDQRDREERRRVIPKSLVMARLTPPELQALLPVVTDNRKTLFVHEVKDEDGNVLASYDFTGAMIKAKFDGYTHIKANDPGPKALLREAGISDDRIKEILAP